MSICTFDPTLHRSLVTFVEIKKTSNLDNSETVIQPSMVATFVKHQHWYKSFSNNIFQEHSCTHGTCTVETFNMSLKQVAIFIIEFCTYGYIYFKHILKSNTFFFLNKFDKKKHDKKQTLSQYLFSSQCIFLEFKWNKK